MQLEPIDICFTLYLMRILGCEQVGLFFATYFVTGCLGITLSFHRQLSHRAFATPKWVEYALAYCGVLAVQVSHVTVTQVVSLEHSLS